MVGNKAPCKGCKDRKIINNKTCHSICEKYKNWVEEMREIEKAINLQRKIDNDSYSMFESMAIRNPNKGGKI